MELKKGLKLFIDTAPIIYFIEEHPIYCDEVSDIFDRTTEGTVPCCCGAPHIKE